MNAQPVNPFTEETLNPSPVAGNTAIPENPEIKTEESKQETKITITNTEPKGSPKYGLLESLRKKWAGHIQTNQERAAAAKAKHEREENEMQEMFLNFNPKKDKKKLTPSLRKKIIQAEKVYNNGVVTIKDLIAPSSVEVTPYYMKVNGFYAKSFFVYNYPRYLEANWLNPIVNYDVSMDMSLFIYPTDSGKMLRILKKKVAEMLSTRNLNKKRGQISDPSLDTALEDAEQLRIDLQRGNERFFQVGIYFTVYSEDEKKLKAVSKQIETILGGQLVTTRPTDFRMERAFETNLPQGTDMLNVTRNMNTSPLSSTFPFVSSSLTSNEGILYGLNRHNNSLIIFDRFKLENANQVVFAKSGAGKSYAVKLDILRSLMVGTDVIVLDPENEYETLTHTIGGTYLKISLNSDQRINPFDLPKPIRDSDTKPGDLLRENIISILGLMNLMLGKMDPYEEGIMDKALLQCYELKGITNETENPTEYEMPTMIDLQNILQSMEGGENLAVRLEKYTSGTFSGVFSKQTNVDLTEGLVVFCIRDLEERLRPIAMYIILNYIWNTVRSTLKPRSLVVDEAWNIVQHEDSARFLHGLVKRARKYYLGITTITQDVEDFMNSAWGKPIITNSSMQLLLRQAPSAIPLLQKTFHLTEGEKYLLLNSGVGQGLFFAGNQHVAIQVIASYGENKIVTTNPQEILANDEANN